MSLALDHKRPVSALYVNGAIFDWAPYVTSTYDPNRNYPCIRRKFAAKNIALENSMDIVQSAYARADISLQGTRHITQQLFSEPAQCFDPRASPILLFRTAGREIPTEFPQLPNTRLPLLFSPSRLSNKIQNTSTPSPIDFNSPIPKACLVFKDSGIGQEQAEEMAMLMNRTWKSKKPEALSTKITGATNNRVELVDGAGIGIERVSDALDFEKWFDTVLH